MPAPPPPPGHDLEGYGKLEVNLSRQLSEKNFDSQQANQGLYYEEIRDNQKI